MYKFLDMLIPSHYQIFFNFEMFPKTYNCQKINSVSEF